MSYNFTDEFHKVILEESQRQIEESELFRERGRNKKINRQSVASSISEGPEELLSELDFN